MRVSGKDLIVAPPWVWEENADFIYSFSAARSQYLVEVIRMALRTDDEHTFWQVFFDRIEALVAEELEYRARGGIVDACQTERYNAITQTIIDEGFREYARRLGGKVMEEHAAIERKYIEVTLVTTSGRGVVKIIPRTEYRICEAVGRKPEFRTYASGQKTGLIGHYVFYVEEGDKHTNVQAVEIDRGGTWTFASP